MEPEKKKGRVSSADKIETTKDSAMAVPESFSMRAKEGVLAAPPRGPGTRAKKELPAPGPKVNLAPEPAARAMSWPSALSNQVRQTNQAG